LPNTTYNSLREIPIAYYILALLIEDIGFIVFSLSGYKGKVNVRGDI
jgi:hypothetical protein